MDLELKNAIEASNKLVADLRSELDGMKSADAISTEKLGKIEADLAKTLSEKSALENRLAAVETLANRPGLAAKGNDAVDEVKSAFMTYLRKPSDSNRSAYEELAAKSVNITTPADGGVAVVPQYGTQLIEVATNLSPIRGLARVINVSNESYKDISLDLVESGWAGENTTRAESNTQTFSEITYKFGEVYSNVPISNAALNDLMFNPWDEVVNKASRVFADKEGAAFVSGTGINMPTGFALPAAGVGTIATGNAATLGAAPVDTLISALYDLNTEYRQNSTFLMNSGTMASLATLKDGDGRYVLVTPLTAGVPMQLLGRPVAVDENVASVAAGATPIFVGDFKRGYTIADLQGISVIADQVTRKGWTLIYVSKRVGGGVTDAAALRGIKVEV